MDERTLENKLRQLKNAYEEIPSKTSYDQILERINEEDRGISQKQNSIVQKVTYAISIAAVFVILVLLIPQFFQIQNTDANEQMIHEMEGKSSIFKDQRAEQLKLEKSTPLTKVYVDVQNIKLQQYYMEKINNLKSILNTNQVENLSFVQKVQSIVGTFISQPISASHTKQEFDKAIRETKKRISETLETPGHALMRLKQDENVLTAKEMQVQLSSILAKQEELMPLYISRWKKINVKSTYNVSDHLSDVIQKLNNPSIIDQLDLKQFASEIRNNGYRFYNDRNDNISIQIDYVGISNQFKGKLNEMSY
jgi:hypothetical protein